MMRVIRPLPITALMVVLLGVSDGQEKTEKTKKKKASNAVAATSSTAAHAAPEPKGSLVGSVHIEGNKAPKAEIIPIGVDVSTCGTEQMREALVVSASGGVQNAVITLLQPPAAGTASLQTTVTVDQRACTFLPHIILIPKNGTVRFTNNDPILHNVRVSSNSEAMNRVATHDVTIEKTFSAEGPHPLKCDFHAWMKGYVFVAKHAYTTITDADGRFAFQVPPGKYEAEVWHETMGSMKTTLEVGKKNEIIYPASKAVVPSLGAEAALEWE